MRRRAAALMVACTPAAGIQAEAGVGIQAEARMAVTGTAVTGTAEAMDPVSSSASVSAPRGGDGGRGTTRSIPRTMGIMAITLTQTTIRMNMERATSSRTTRHTINRAAGR